MLALGRRFQDLVGLVELLGAAAVAAGVAALTLTLVETAGADAQYRFDLRQLERRHAEPAGHPGQQVAYRTFHVVARQRGPDLDLEEHPQELGTPLAGVP